MKDVYLLLNGTVALALLVLGFVVLLSNVRSRVNRLFFAFTASVSVWVAAAYVSNNVNYPPIVSLVGNYFVFAFSYFSGSFFLWLTTYIVRSQRTAKVLRWLSAPIVAVGLISASPLVVAGVSRQDSVYAVEFGPLTAAYAIMLVGQLVLALVLLARGMKQASGNHRKRLKVILRSMTIALPVLIITQFVAPAITGSFAITDIGIIAMVLPVVGLYYSVVKHGLFDIRLAAVRTMVYACVLVTLSIVYYVLVYAVSLIFSPGGDGSHAQLNIPSLGIVVLLAYLFQPVKRFFDKLTDGIFYRQDYNTDDFYARINRELNATTKLRSLLQRAITEISSTLKAEHGHFFLRYGDERSVTVGIGHYTRLSSTDLAEIDRYLAIHGRGVVVEELLSEGDALHDIMHKYRLGIILPLSMNEKPIGYLLLGISKVRNYTQRDIRLLETISDELVIAIQNALSIQEVEEINETLQQRIDDATKELRTSNRQLQKLDEAKDEFVSMASHQLRTPLTSVKGYISMVLEGDVGDITPMQRKLLEEAFTSSERMVHLINDFLNVSRLQTGKFMLDARATDLAKVVGQEVDALQAVAASRNLKLHYRAPARLPQLYIDEGKIRQVIMNFIDNAIYYSREHTTITIRLARDDGDMLLEVHDTGIGVPIAEQAHLFTKFFRATNARKQRPDGTGVGLFLAKKVITSHGGHMVFSSVEGEGSVFGFRLPIKKLLEAPARSADELENQPSGS